MLSIQSAIKIRNNIALGVDLSKSSEVIFHWCTHKKVHQIQSSVGWAMCYERSFTILLYVKMKKKKKTYFYHRKGPSYFNSVIRRVTIFITFRGSLLKTLHTTVCTQIENLRNLLPILAYTTVVVRLGGQRSLKEK